jgi:uncharacterized damage-inducible protein DinB
MSVFPQTSADPASAFLEQSRAFLRDEYVPKILRCLGALSDDDIWWRPNPVSNSVGNLVLHLCGNARQWIIAGIEGGHDIRVRSAEFAAEGGFSGETLARLLKTTMQDVDAAMADITESSLSESRSIQGFDMTVLQGIYHVVEHFSGHAGQIAYITKLRSAMDLAFYDAAPDGSVGTNW